MKVTQLCWTLWPHGLCGPWNSSGQNTGVGSLSLLQGIFLTQELNRGLLHCRRFFFFFYQLSYQGSPKSSKKMTHKKIQFSYKVHLSATYNITIIYFFLFNQITNILHPYYIHYYIVTSWWINLPKGSITCNWNWFLKLYETSMSCQLNCWEEN